MEKKDANTIKIEDIRDAFIVVINHVAKKCKEELNNKEKQTEPSLWSRSWEQLNRPFMTGLLVTVVFGYFFDVFMSRSQQTIDQENLIFQYELKGYSATGQLDAAIQEEWASYIDYTHHLFCLQEPEYGITKSYLMMEGCITDELVTSNAIKSYRDAWIIIRSRRVILLHEVEAFLPNVQIQGLDLHTLAINYIHSMDELYETSSYEEYQTAIEDAKIKKNKLLKGIRASNRNNNRRFTSQ